MPSDPRFPSIIYGTITSKNLPVADRLLCLKDVRLNEFITILTDENGNYAVNAANYASAYNVGDTIIISLKDDSPEMDDNISVQNGKIMLTR